MYLYVIQSSTQIGDFRYWLQSVEQIQTEVLLLFEMQTHISII